MLAWILFLIASLVPSLIVHHLLFSLPGFLLFQQLVMLAHLLWQIRCLKGQHSGVQRSHSKTDILQLHEGRLLRLTLGDADWGD